MIKLTFIDFKKKHLKYQERYDYVFDKIVEDDEDNERSWWNKRKYKIYDKYQNLILIDGVNNQEAELRKKCFNEEDEAYLHEVYYYCYHNREFQHYVDELLRFYINE